MHAAGFARVRRLRTFTTLSIFRKFRVSRLLCAALCTGVFCFAARDAFAENRSYDGSGNNVSHSNWGSVGSIFLRKSETGYNDGFSSMGGGTRPGPREISNAVVQQNGSMINSRGLSDWVWQWGQFVDHDLDLSPAADPAESANIAVPANDPVFGFSSIPFNRSVYQAGTGTGPGNERCQMNMVSSWLDGSMIYGSNPTTANALREPGTGRMQVTAHATGNLLPMSGGMFQAGDERANEQLGLTSVHTLFVREHNRIADEVAGANPSWSPDQVYQRARKIVGAEVQAITFNEWLPALLGGTALPEYAGYADDVDGTVANEFATALFRVGHTMLSPNIRRLDGSGNTIPEGDISLRDAFFQPDRILDEGGVDPLLKGLASQRMQEVDGHIVEDVRSFLFTIPTGGMDLASLNIQRGRDHGLPDYNAVREAYGLAPVDDFADITSDLDMLAALAATYGDVDNIDPWVGALAEDHLPGSSLGELLTAGILDQFLRLRDGDRFWYENDPELADLRDMLASTSLSDIILRNTTITNLQGNVFFVPEPTAGVLLVLGAAFAATRRRRSR